MIDITGLAHVGIRVADFGRSIRFYRDMGFSVVRDDLAERIVVLSHPAGVVVNLLDSASDGNGGRNVLMDEAPKYPGYTHIALSVDDLHRTEKLLREHGISITEGPVTFGDGSTSLFFRDPDRNVIELTEAGSDRRVS